jgi:hypothetical protein
MNKSSFAISIAIITVCMMLHSTRMEAQLNLPQPSPKASVMQTIGITDIKLIYHKPSVKGRVIWGDVVPFDSVWRTGANEATIISFSTEVMVEDHPLTAGKYALYTIPGKEEWTVIFNKKKELMGPYTYDKAFDILRIKVKPMDNEMTESMLFHFTDVTLNSCTINLDWEKLRIPVKMKVATDSLFMNSIKSYIHDEPDNAAFYSDGAEYTLMSGLHMDLGVQWAEMAINYKPNYYGYWLRGNIRVKLGKYDEALEDLNKGLEVAKKDKDYANVKPEFEKAIAECKSKMKR